MGHSSYRLQAMANEQQPTLLLVDDEDNILAALKRVLRDEGYRIVTSNDARQALELIAEMEQNGVPVDVVLSDQRMAAMSGIEFLKRVRNSHPDTVRLVLSGYTDLQSITDAINEGAVYKFLTKPWEDDQLKASLREAFQRKAMRDENLRLTRELAEANIRLTAANQELSHLLEDRRIKSAMIEAALDTTQEIIQLIPWPIIGLDDDGMIALVNSAAESQLGHGDALLGMPADTFLPADLAAGLLDPATLPASSRLGDRQYRIVCRTMGKHSHSHGKLLALLPEAMPS